MLNRLLTSVVLAALAVPGSAGAQRPDGPPDPQQRQAFLMDIMGTQLNLNKDQRGQLQGILDRAREAATPLHEQVAKSREAIRNAIRDGKSGAALDPYHKQLGHQFAQLMAIESKAYAELFAILTPEQKASADVGYNMLGMLLAPPRPGGDRRGGGGGRGSGGPRKH
ncbi:MAG: Spy/CpxP family protein refolding chaperone [Acidobacteria bacterium]|nr:Spy/CpxP family protein refolding chaperone [Acidobacteriota bacterium]